MHRSSVLAFTFICASATPTDQTDWQAVAEKYAKDLERCKVEQIQCRELLAECNGARRLGCRIEELILRVYVPHNGVPVIASETRHPDLYR